MVILKDPEGNETACLHTLIDFTNLSVLEIGCGEGRLTWRYAIQAAHVTAIDPDAKAIETARANTPKMLMERVRFLVGKIEDFPKAPQNQLFDVAIFAWSL